MTKDINPTAPTAADIYNNLEIAASGKKQRIDTLHRLKNACDMLVESGKDFSLRDIEDYCKKTFNKGPNAQSISNDGSLRAYADSRRKEADLTRRGKYRSPLNQEVENIPDLDLRSRMRLIVADYNLVKKQYRILTEALSKPNPAMNLDMLYQGKAQDKLAPTTTTDEKINSEHLGALSQLVAILGDQKFLHRIGLDTDSGSVISRGLRETFINMNDIKLLNNLLVILGGKIK